MTAPAPASPPDRITAATIAAGLTRGQAAQLILLKAMNAISERTAICRNGRRGDELSTITLGGILAPRGFVHIGARPPGPGMATGRTIYWLTDKGLTVADLLTREIDPISGPARPLPKRSLSR